MARNIVFTMTTGSTGKVLWFLFEPTDPETGVASPLDLTGATVTLRVLRGSTAVENLDDVACVPAVDQVANIGEGTFTFSEEQAELAPDEYKLRFKAVVDGVPYFFPELPNRTYGVLKVLAQ